MAKRKSVRVLIVNGQSYLWRFHNRRYISETAQYDDAFRAWLPSQKSHPLEIRFTPDDHFTSGDPLNHGSAPCVASDPASIGVNLHQPIWAATLIRIGIDRGWHPEESALIIEDGMAMLAELKYKPYGASQWNTTSLF